MKFKSLTALLIAGLLFLTGCEKVPSEVSEGDLPQSGVMDGDSNSNINSEYASGGEEGSGEEGSNGDVSGGGEESAGGSSGIGDVSGEESGGEISVPRDSYTKEWLGEGKISILKMPGKRPDDGDLYTIADADGKLLYPFQFNRVEKFGVTETEYVALYTEVNSILYTADGKEVALPYGEYSGYMYVNGVIAACKDSTKSYVMIDADGKPYENIPEFQEFHPKYPTSGMVITRNRSDKKADIYLRFSGKGKFDVYSYNKNDKSAAEKKYRGKILEVVNGFIRAAQNGTTEEMSKFATSKLVSYADMHLVGMGTYERRYGLCMPLFMEVLAKEDTELAKKQQLAPNDLYFIYIDDTWGGHSEALFYFPELVTVNDKQQIEYSDEPYKVSVVRDSNGDFKVDGIWRDYDEDKELLPPNVSQQLPWDYVSAFEEYKIKYSRDIDSSIKWDKKASIIHGYMGSEYGVVDADDRILYPCIYDSANYYGLESPDIIILSDWRLKKILVLDAWGKEIEFQGDGEYSRFSYFNGAIAAFDEKTELYTLFRIDGTPYENIPSFKTKQHFPTKNLAITYTENGVEKGAYLRITGRRSFELVPYGKAEKQAAEDKYRKKIIDVFNSFTDALRSGDKEEMLKYATEDLVYYAETGCDGGRRNKYPNELKGMLAYNIPESIEKQRVNPDGPVFFYIDDSKGGISECFFMMLRYVEDYGYEEPFDGEPIGLTFVCDGNGGFKLDSVDVYCQEDTGLLFERSMELKEKEKQK